MYCDFISKLISSQVFRDGLRPVLLRLLELNEKITKAVPPAAAAEEILSKPLLNQNKYLNRHILICCEEKQPEGKENQTGVLRCIVEKHKVPMRRTVLKVNWAVPLSDKNACT